MVRFSCFHSHIHGEKTKKQPQPSFESMIKTLQAGSQGKAVLNSSNPGSLDQSPSAVRNNYESGNDGKSSQESYCGEMNNDANNSRISPMRQFRRSLSLGFNLQEEGRISEENNSDEYTDQQFSWNGHHDQEKNLPTPVGFRSPVATITDQDQEEATVDPLNYSCREVNHESIFCIGDQQYPKQEGHESCPVNGEAAIRSGILTPQTPTKIPKSSSLPHLQSMLSRSGVCSPCGLLAYRNRSSEDLNVLMTRKETCAHDLSVQQFAAHNEDYLYKSDKCNGQDGVPDGYEESYKYSASNRDWIVPVSDDEAYGAQTFQGESSSLKQHQLPNEDYKMKWIEEWVSEIQECNPVDEIDETKKFGPVEKTSEMPASLDVGNRVSLAKEEANLSLSILAAKRYISSLGAGASTAQLANLGLTVIPFLSAFVSLKVVNLSGNSIVRITAGALPRGLHMLNLSKNKISTIEGLRELTRLRILDLSYNRITRIGHGLASCSTLKELYLAGNKISEVEGLHRLLKLAVLDLRFNKISTSKCLGQLAANYNSLQAISLEGNPAQKNVGDEQLKKHLQGLLPHLVYYNRQTIKSNSVKDSSERSVRLGMSGHQFDRGHKSDHKSARRAGHGSSSLKQSSVHSKVDSPKWSRSKHGYVPPAGSRTSQRHHHHQPPPLELSMKPLVLSDFGMKKSQSVGALAAL